MARQPAESVSSALEVHGKQDSFRTALAREVTEIYQATATSLLRYALLLARSESLAQEAVQETFLKYYHCRIGGELGSATRGWFFRVVRNYIFDQLKSHSVKNCVSLDHAVTKFDERYSPEKLYEQSQTVQKAYGLLAPRELECLRLKVEGFSYQEIAEILDIKSGTVGALLARGATKIQKGFAQD